MYLYASGIDVASFNDFGSVISGWYFFLHVIQNNFSILQSVQKAMQNKPSLEIIIIELGWSP